MLENCLKSLSLQSDSDFKVIVVDNGSSDNTVDFLKDSYPEVTIINFEKNTGFSVAINAGINCTEADWVFLLNNDMEVDSNCIKNIKSAIKEYSAYDFFALKMFNYHDRTLLDGAGDAVLRGGVGYRLGTLEVDSRQYQYNRETFGACAGAGVYSKEFFAKVGSFDPDFFAYLEDVDLNMRARKLGFKCMYLAHAKVYHIGSATSGSKINPLTIRLSTRNNLTVILKNYPFVVLIHFLPAIIVYQLLWALFCLKKRMLVPYLQGLLEGLRMVRTNLAKRKVLKEENSNWLDKNNAFRKQVELAEKDAVQSIMSRRSSQGKSNLMLELYCKIFL